jgi:hypothetical protein
MRYIDAMSALLDTGPNGIGGYNMRNLGEYINTLTDIDERDDKLGRTLLQSAIGMVTENGYGNHVVKYLLEKRADVNIAINGRLSLLSLAATNGCVDTVKLLVAAGLDIQTPPPYPQFEYAPVYQALYHPKMLEYLITIGCNPHYVDGNNKTLLMHAASIGQIGSVRVLLDAGQNPELKDNRGFTALDWAAHTGSGQNPFRLLFYERHPETMNLLDGELRRRKMIRDKTAVERKLAFTMAGHDRGGTSMTQFDNGLFRMINEITDKIVAEDYARSLFPVT